MLKYLELQRNIEKSFKRLFSSIIHEYYIYIKLNTDTTQLNVHVYVQNILY